VFLYLLLHKTPATPGSNTPGTNFFASFNPFGKKPTPPAETPPANVTENTPPATNNSTPSPLKKVSSMPIAGFGIFSKERYKEVPVETTVITPDTGSTDSTASSSGTPGGAVSSTSGTTTTTTTTKNNSKPTPPKTEFATAVRYAARADGNIYETFADNIDERKFSSTVIPQIYDAYFGAGAQSVVMRYLDNEGRIIETFAGSLPKEVLGADTENNELKGAPLPENVFDLSLSPDLSKIFYLFTANDSATGITANVAGDSKVQVFSSPFTEWLSFWPNSKMITLTTKPASGLPGYMYAFDPAKKVLNKVFGGVNGLTTLASPDGKTILYANDSLTLGLYDIATNNSYILAARTLPDKCVWGTASDVIYCAVPRTTPPGAYPDDWYKGKVSFSDQIWKIDVASKTASVIIDPLSEPGGEDIDGIKLALDKDQNYLFFVNKKDSFLWELSLK
jgi:hypothetical protein